MKIFKSAIFIAITILAFFSCQKEINFDNNGISVGLLKKDVAGDCLPVVVTGNFKKDSVLTNANYVDVQVTVSTPGTFDIRSDTVNGYAFSKAGTVVFGINTIRLYASGKPLVPGTNTFTIKYGASTCSFDVTVTGSVGTSEYTIEGAPLTCTGVTAAGIYTAGKPLDFTNTLTITVNVTKLGTYGFGAASTNGFIFAANGTFSTLGLQNVTLNGSGTPITAGPSAITISNFTSTCTYGITVLPSSPAVFTMEGSPNTCINFTVGGTYIVGIATSISNTVSLKVNVATPGAYTISISTVNGISFPCSGVFTNTGLQDVIIQAVGVPLVAASFSFTATGGGTTCNFSVTCLPAVTVPPGDYFPLTANSWWSYDVIAGGVPQIDSVLLTSGIIASQNSTSYREFVQQVGGVATDSLYFRKNGNDYYQWAPADYFSSLFAFDVEQFTDILFLKENVASGTTWSSPEYTGPASGIATKLKYGFRIENANTSITVNGKNYTNVIRVNVAVQISILASPYTTLESNDFYYAKGIGLVKISYKDASGGTVTGEANIRSYQVF